MLFFAAYFRYQVRFSVEAPKKLTPEPAKVIFEVEAKTKGRLGFPAAAASPRTSYTGAAVSVSGCTAYALSQNRRKSGAAVGIETSSRTTSSEKFTPVGLE